jgi:hypothetical protein
MDTFVMTVRRKRALRAVEAGLVKRRYSDNGNTFLRITGIQPHVMCQLLHFKLIEDGPHENSNVVTMILTPAGKGVLDE